MKIGIIANPEKSLVKTVLPELIRWLAQHNQEVWVSELDESLVLGLVDARYVVSAPELVQVCEVIFAIGGDGTLLNAARIVGKSEKPILGINLGGLGFLTEVSLDDLYPALNRLLNSQYEIEPRLVLEAVVSSNRLYGLNDVVITGIGTGRMLEFELKIDGNYVSNFSADGLIFSTPTGSTAYSLAALGPILHPSTEAIVVNLICPHTLGARPIVVGAASIIEAKCESADSTVVVDGQDRIPLSQSEKVVVRKAHYEVKLIKSGIRNFYEILRTKLKWGGGKER